MGTLKDTLGDIGSSIGSIRTIGSAFTDLSGQARSIRKKQHEFAMKSLQEKQAQSTAQAQANAELQRKKIALEAGQAEDKRLAALRRAVAKRNASFGASGVGGTDGSREAILLGMYNDSEDDKMNRENLDNLRYNTIDNNLSNISARNILEKTQLAERQSIANIGNIF